MTIAFTAFILVMTFLALRGVKDDSLNIKELNERSFPFEELEASDYTVEQLHQVFVYKFYAIIAKRSYQSCDQVTMKVTSNVGCRS